MDDPLHTIKIICLADGSDTPFDDQYVVSYDPGEDGIAPDGGRMLCKLETTPDYDRAGRFVDPFEVWRAVDPRQPLRPDGKPNRPLTACSVEIKQEVRR